MKDRVKIALTLIVLVAISLATLLALNSGRTPGSLGFAAISGDVTVIEAQVIGVTSSGAGAIERAYEVAWSKAAKSVPAGKKWVVVVTPTDQFAYTGDSRERWRGFTLNLMGVFRQGDQVYHSELPAGNYTDLDLYIYNTMQFFADTPVNHAWAKVPVLYLILELNVR